MVSLAVAARSINFHVLPFAWLETLYLHPCARLQKPIPSSSPTTMLDQQSLASTSSHSRSDSVWTTTTASSSSALSTSPSSPTSVNYAYAFWGVPLDPACLEAIDDQLLECPTAAFADVCWQQAVKDPARPRRPPRRTPTITSITPSSVQELPDPTPLRIPSMASSRRASTPVRLPNFSPHNVFSFLSD